MATLIKETAITFSDVLIVPQYSEVLSRVHVDITSDMGPFKLRVPIISANMKDITGAKMAYELSKLGALGILHRFMPIEENVNAFYDCMIDEDNNPYSVGVSVGVKEEEKERFLALKKAGAKIFCVDVAHGDHILVKNMLTFIRENSDRKDTYVIAGNIATKESAINLIEWGTDCLKCGIGPGAACMTRANAGVGVPQLTALKEIKEMLIEKNLTHIKLISDGGIKNTGDIAKALAYADAVMVGSILSGTSETPGAVFQNPEGQFYKTYGGSASGENKVKSGNANRFVEGVVKTVPFKGHVKYIIRKIEDGVRSAFSYSDAKNLKEFQENVILRMISGGGKSESKI